MSALSESPSARHGWRRPSLFRLTGAVLAGEVLAAILLWGIGALLSLAAIAPLGGPQTWVWLPWRIDGIWAAIGAVGWGYLVCALVGALVADAISRRGYERPDTISLRLAVAVSGYGAMAVGATGGARVVVAVVAGAMLIRLAVLRPDGAARHWTAVPRWAAGRRVRTGLFLAAVVAALSYSVTHPFAADGGGGTYSNATTFGGPGLHEQIEVGLSRTRLPVTITAATLTGPGAGELRIDPATVSVDNVPSTQDDRLPYHLSASQIAWISATFRVVRCRTAATLDTLRLRYTVLGIPTGETIPLQQPFTLHCAANWHP